MFIFYSLRTWSVRLSLAHKSVIIPSYNTYKVSCESTSRLISRPFNALTEGLLASFNGINAPSSSTMVFVIHVSNIWSTTEDSTIPTWAGVPIILATALWGPPTQFGSPTWNHQEPHWWHHAPLRWCCADCWVVKRVFLTSIYPTLIINLGTICYLKSVLSLRQSLVKSNASSIVLLQK